MSGRPVELDDLFSIRTAADPQLSPDGATVAFVVQSVDRDADEARSALWTVGSQGGEPVQLTYGTSDGHPRWSPDGRTLAFLRAEAGSRPQIYLLPTRGGEARKLTALPMGATTFQWSPDGTRFSVLGIVDIDGEPADDAERAKRASAPVVIRNLLFKADGAGLLRGLRVHLHVVDAQTGDAEQLTKNDLSVSASNWSPDGARIAYSATLAEDRDIDARSRVFVVDAGGGEADEIVRWTGTASVPVWSPDGAHLAFAGMERSGSFHTDLFTVPSMGGTPEPVAPSFDRNVMLGGPAYPGAEHVWCADGRIVFCARDRGCTHAFAVEATGGDPVTVVGGEGRVVSGLSTHDGRRMAVTLSTPDIPSDVFLFDADERRLTTLNADVLDEVSLHEPRPRIFTAPDGTQLQGWVIRGDGDGAQPLLVDIHGGPHNAWNPAWNFASIQNEILASQGWSVLLLNPRGSDGYGQDFYRAAIGAWGEGDEGDFLAAIDELVEDGSVDPARLAVTGYSYGGYMTNWLTARTDRFKAAVTGGCVTNKTSVFGTSDIGPLLGVFELGEELRDAPDRYVAISPLTYAKGVTTPTLILHGEADDRCPVSQAEEWFAALKRLGTEVEFVRYPGGSHLFPLLGRPSHRADYVQRVVDWVTKHTP